MVLTVVAAESASDRESTGPHHHHCRMAWMRHNMRYWRRPACGKMMRRNGTFRWSLIGDNPLLRNSDIFSFSLVLKDKTAVLGLSLGLEGLALVESLFTTLWCCFRKIPAAAWELFATNRECYHWYGWMLIWLFCDYIVLDIEYNLSDAFIRHRVCKSSV